jgi:hypothetical protein
VSVLVSLARPAIAATPARPAARMFNPTSIFRHCRSLRFSYSALKKHNFARSKNSVRRALSASGRSCPPARGTPIQRLGRVRLTRHARRGIAGRFVRFFLHRSPTPLVLSRWPYASRAQASSSRVRGSGRQTPQGPGRRHANQSARIPGRCRGAVTTVPQCSSRRPATCAVGLSTKDRFGRDARTDQGVVGPVARSASRAEWPCAWRPSSLRTRWPWQPAWPPPGSPVARDLRGARRGRSPR